MLLGDARNSFFLLSSNMLDMDFASWGPSEVVLFVLDAVELLHISVLALAGSRMREVIATAIREGPLCSSRFGLGSHRADQWLVLRDNRLVRHDSRVGNTSAHVSDEDKIDLFSVATVEEDEVGPALAELRVRSDWTVRPGIVEDAVSVAVPYPVAETSVAFITFSCFPYVAIHISRNGDRVFRWHFGCILFNQRAKVVLD